MEWAHFAKNDCHMSKLFPHHHLPNYLRTHRKRVGFSQEEIAFLLSIKTGAPISRYERFTRKPTLAVVFAFEIIFEVPAKEIFSGVRQEIAEKLTHRAVLLLERVLREKKRLPATKLQLLERIAGSKKR
jgi:transcriptional regulator with XRE-family HTH domain